MKLSQFKFKLPEDKIALHPTKYRDESRLMVLHRNTGKNRCAYRSVLVARVERGIAFVGCIGRSGT